MSLKDSGFRFWLMLHSLLMTLSFGLSFAMLFIWCALNPISHQPENASRRVASSSRLAAGRLSIKKLVPTARLLGIEYLARIRADNPFRKAGENVG
jgi:hypothetical protein